MLASLMLLTTLRPHTPGCCCSAAMLDDVLPCAVRPVSCKPASCIQLRDTASWGMNEAPKIHPCPCLWQIKLLSSDEVHEEELRAREKQASQPHAPALGVHARMLFAEPWQLQMATLQRMRHPGIVLTLGGYFSKDVMYILTELMAIDLASALDAPEWHKQLQWEARRVLALQCCCAAALQPPDSGHEGCGHT